MRVVFLLVALLTLSACQTNAGVRARQASAAPVVREILAQVEHPPGAPGRRLTLVRYTIAPGAELPPHVHPGVQVASIVAGTLTYRVLSGAATVQRRVNARGVPATVEVLTGPAQTELAAGDAVIEEAAMRHFGANRTARPVVILATLLTDPALDLAVPAPGQ